ncbi:hypothetical protein PROFUN_00406 [Planoprotostelium fungivorum]|uniref:Talin N-terminal F0 domain-containing protein n=1 Tax=Planoprotostelium fungivorum TaxID=1890364 RepID=A0A2P6NYD3_9EUKA|nr:hypothetical protein PROFUN_00406 [Planoprotostelium fungivorum]
MESFDKIWSTTSGQVPEEPEQNTGSMNDRGLLFCLLLCTFSYVYSQTILSNGCQQWTQLSGKFNVTFTDSTIQCWIITPAPPPTRFKATGFYNLGIYPGSSGTPIGIYNGTQLWNQTIQVPAPSVTLALYLYYTDPNRTYGNRQFSVDPYKSIDIDLYCREQGPTFSFTFFIFPLVFGLFIYCPFLQSHDPTQRSNRLKLLVGLGLLPGLVGFIVIVATKINSKRKNPNRNKSNLMSLYLKIAFPPTFPIASKTFSLDSSLTVGKGVTIIKDKIKNQLSSHTADWGLYLPQKKIWLDDDVSLGYYSALIKDTVVEFRDRGAQGILKSNETVALVLVSIASIAAALSVVYIMKQRNQ